MDSGKNISESNFAPPDSMELLNDFEIFHLNPVSQYQHLLPCHDLTECRADSSQVIQFKQSLQGEALLKMAIRHLVMAKEAGDTLASICLGQGLVWDSGQQIRSVELGTPKECFKNAAELTRKDKSLAYVEGYAYKSGMPVHHAWNVNHEGKVIDNTWQCGRLYIGLPVKTATLWRCIEETECWGVFNYTLPKWLLQEISSGVRPNWHQGAKRNAPISCATTRS